jgi:hypothetical protein
VLFPAFRSYLAARKTVNDELMAIVVGAAIADRALMPPAPQGALLSEWASDIPGVLRMNQSIACVRTVLGKAPGTVARTAIPYMLAVYAVYLADAIGMLRQAGLDVDPHEPDDTHLKALHGRFMAAATTALPERDVALFEISRMVRNRLVHQAGAPGSKLRAEWARLSPDAKDEWIRVAGRPLIEAISTRDEPLDLDLGELFATLAVTHRLAHRINGVLVQRVPARVWADLLVADYRELWPRRYGNSDQRLRRLSGYARQHYGALELDSDELREAVRRVDGLYR